MRINKAGLELIEKSEGLRLQPYQDSRKIWTEGYGHTRGVTAESPQINGETAEEWLQIDIEDAETSIEKYITAPLNENQFSALTSLVYNCGYDPLIGHLGQKLNAKDYDGAAAEFEKWDRSDNKEIAGLLTRRQAEKELFLTPVYEAFYEV